jgi:hypothetical protein
VFADYYLLGRALRAYLGVHVPGAAHRTVLGVNRVLGASQRAALLGFHRAELEGADQWPGRVDELVRAEATEARVHAEHGG